MGSRWTWPTCPCPAQNLLSTPVMHLWRGLWRRPRLIGTPPVRERVRFQMTSSVCYRLWAQWISTVSSFGYSFRHTTKRTCCIVPTSLGDVAGSTSPNGSTPTLPPLSSTSQPSSNDTNRPHRRVMLPPIGTITCYFSQLQWSKGFHSVRVSISF